MVKTELKKLNKTLEVWLIGDNLVETEREAWSYENRNVFKPDEFIWCNYGPKNYSGFFISNPETFLLALQDKRLHTLLCKLDTLPGRHPGDTEITDSLIKESKESAEKIYAEMHSKAA